MKNCRLDYIRSCILPLKIRRSRPGDGKTRYEITRTIGAGWATVYTCVGAKELETWFAGWDAATKCSQAEPPQAEPTPGATVLEAA